MSWAVECVGMIGCSWAAAAWLAQGLDEKDRRACAACAARVAELALREVWLVKTLLVKIAQRGSRGSRQDGVSLGALAEMVDVVRLGLSAGLSFDAALELYCAERSGPLSRRMSQARLSWQMGLGTREEELTRAAWDLGVRPLESFAATVSQALSLGAPLSETLASQSREMRAAHRASVEREIERIPVKLLIPTGTLILPALLLSIVGPLLAASGML